MGNYPPDEKVSARERNDVCGGSLPVDALNPPNDQRASNDRQPKRPDD